jgi:hypothetical protein
MAVNKAVQEGTATNPELAEEAKDNVNAEPTTLSNAKKHPKARHRASVACASCRDRRIRVCLIHENQ